MNAGEFAYWLQGALEINPEMLEKGMTPEQVQTIQDHLNLVFDKITPDRFDSDESIKNITLTDLRIANSGPSTGPSGSQLFCSQISEHTSSLAEDLSIHMNGEKDERNKSTEVKKTISEKETKNSPLSC